MKEIFILGAGVTGLSAGLKLSQKGFNVTLIESESQVGGLAKTIKFNNSSVDIGPHSFFSEDREIYYFVKNLFKDNQDQLPMVKRSVKMFFMNYYVDYPLSAKSILFQMGPVIPIKSFLSFCKSYLSTIFKKQVSKDANIEDWAIQNFGYFLYKNFFKPYTEQFWKIDAKELSNKVIPASKKLDFAKTLKHLFINKYLEISKREPGSLNLVQRESLPTFYPKKGFGEIPKKMATLLSASGGLIKLNEKVENIKKKDKFFLIRTNKNEYKSEILISTLPIDSLAEIFDTINKNKENLNTAKKLQYLALKIVYLVIKKKNFLKYQYCYFVGRPYNRISNLNLFSNDLNSKNHTTISLEISCLKDSEMWKKSDQEILDICIENLEKDKVLTKEDVIDKKIMNFPNVYPIYRNNYDKDLKKIETEFQNIQNFYSIGRMGKFFYGDIDQMIRMGFNLSSKIN